MQLGFWCIILEKDFTSKQNLKPRASCCIAHALCPDPVHPGLKLLNNLAMLIPREGLTQLLDNVFPFHSKIVNNLVKLAASQNKRTLKEAEDEGGEDDQEEDRLKKKARITYIIILLSQ